MRQTSSHLGFDSLQKVEEDSVVQVKPGSNDAEMDDAAHKMVAQRRAMWPRATSKGYRKGLVCWATFCTRRQFTDADLVHEKKVLLFLKEDVLTMRIRKKGAKRMDKLRVFPAGQETLVFPSCPRPGSVEGTKRGQR